MHRTTRTSKSSLSHSTQSFVIISQTPAITASGDIGVFCPNNTPTPTIMSLWAALTADRKTLSNDFAITRALTYDSIRIRWNIELGILADNQFEPHRCVKLVIHSVTAKPHPPTVVDVVSHWLCTYFVAADLHIWPSGSEIIAALGYEDHYVYQTEISRGMEYIPQYMYKVWQLSGQGLHFTL